MIQVKTLLNTKHAKNERLIASFLGAALFISVSLHTQYGHAEQIAVPGASASHVERPRRGIDKAQVEARFGSPQAKYGPTGDPAIYFWEYPEYTVYFENNIVIHSVSKTKSLKAQ